MLETKMRGKNISVVSENHGKPCRLHFLVYSKGKKTAARIFTEKKNVT